MDSLECTRVVPPRLGISGTNFRLSIRRVFVGQLSLLKQKSTYDNLPAKIGKFEPHKVGPVLSYVPKQCFTVHPLVQLKATFTSTYFKEIFLSHTCYHKDWPRPTRAYFGAVLFKQSRLHVEPFLLDATLNRISYYSRHLHRAHTNQGTERLLRRKKHEKVRRMTIFLNFQDHI